MYNREKKINLAIYGQNIEYYWLKYLRINILVINTVNNFIILINKFIINNCKKKK